MNKKLLPTGTTLYSISESTTDYRFRRQPYHYEIVKGKVSEIIRGGYTEYKNHNLGQMRKQLVEVCADELCWGELVYELG